MSGGGVVEVPIVAELDEMEMFAVLLQIAVHHREVYVDAITRADLVALAEARPERVGGGGRR